eukprot:12426970-Karenia_brevis.AAC.1
MFGAPMVRPPEGYTGVGGRLTKIQKTTRPGNVWPEVWLAMNGRQRREAQILLEIESVKREHARNAR